MKATFLYIPFLLFGLFAGFPAAVLADVHNGLDHYDAGRFEEAYRAFRDAAERGDHQSQMNLGVMYLRGEYVERDLIESYAWFALSAQNAKLAEQGTQDVVFSHLDDAQKKQAKARYDALLQTYGKDALIQRMQPTFSGTGFSVRRYRPIYQYPPEYPRSALRRGKEGWVDFLFTVEKDGTTSDHFAYFSMDDRFTEAALKALRGFQFEPNTIDGDPALVHGVTYRFIFELDEGKDHEKLRGRIVDRNLTRVRADADTGRAQDQFVYGYLSQAAQSYGGADYLSPENRQNPNDWFLKAARQGHSSAGFFLGRNILYGDACEADSDKSHFWLLQSANDGDIDAQYLLALELFSGARFTKHPGQALFWLKEAATQKQAARLRYAWVLVTHPDEKVRNALLAHTYWDSLDDDYPDRQRYYMTAAAIAAERGDFEQAVHWQEKALEDAKQLKLPLAGREAHLALYREGKPLRELP